MVKLTKDVKVLLGVVVLILVFVFLQKKNENFLKSSNAGGRCNVTWAGNKYKCKSGLECVNKKCVKPKK